MSLVATPKGHVPLASCRCTGGDLAMRLRTNGAVVATSEEVAMS